MSMDYKVFYDYKDNFKQMVGDILRGKVNFDFSEFFTEYDELVGGSPLKNYENIDYISYKNGVLNIDDYSEITDIDEIKEILSELSYSFDEFTDYISKRRESIKELEDEFCLN